MNDQIKIFIVDNSEPTLLMLNLWLDNMEELDVVGNALTSESFKDRVIESDADVVICNWHVTGKSYSQIKQIKSSPRPPALISIRDGNFLPLEGVLNQSPETLIPTTATCESLLECIRRSAVKRRLVAREEEIAKVEEIGFSEAC